MSTTRIPETPRPDVDLMGGRMVTWAHFGVPDPWIDRCFRPICRQIDEMLVQGESAANIHDLIDGDVEWDVLLLGDHGANGDTLEARVRRVARKHALNCIIAVTHDDIATQQLALMRAGAVDVIGQQSSAERIEQALALAVSIIQSRRAYAEKEKLSLLAKLVVTVNHEINNPLTGLMGAAELLRMENADLSEKSLRDIDTIIQQCRRIQEITSRLKGLKELRTVPYGSHEEMLDLLTGFQQPLIGTEPQQAEQQFLPSLSILVVDDNPLISDLITRLFEQRFRIDSAGCASDALRMLGDTPYDMALLDLILPEMNGLELFREMRKLRPRQKVLLMTAYQGDLRVEQAIEEGALGCIFKPFKLEDLEKALTNALRGSRD